MKKKKILVIDIGGTNVKLMISREERRKFPSGAKMGPREFLAAMKEEIGDDWEFEAIALGFPAPVKDGAIAKDPKHLGSGWVGFDLAKGLGKPVKVMNDAAMQALGSYHGGRMLFLGLGTGLGSTLVWPDHVLPLELGDLPYGDGSIEDRLGDAGLESIGRKQWQRDVRFAIQQLKLAMIADYVVLGGGNAKLVEELPEGVELGHNRNAYPGGCRLFDTETDGRRSKWTVI